MTSLGESAAARAEAALDLRRFDEALRAAGQVIAQQPGAALGHLLLTRALLGLRRPAEAQRAAETGLAAEPRSEWLLRLRALALRHQGRHREALAAAAEAVATAPNEPLVQFVRSLCLADLRRWPAARDAAAEAVRQGPGRSELHRQLGNCLFWSARRRPAAQETAEAEVHLRRAVALEPGSAAALNDLGVVLQATGRREEAARLFRAALAAEPSLWAAKVNLLGAQVGRAVFAFCASLAVFFAGLAVAVHRSSPPHSNPRDRAGLLLVCWGLAAVCGLGALGAGPLTRWLRRREVGRSIGDDPGAAALLERLERDRQEGRLRG